jgi:hypothetical protein
MTTMRPLFMASGHENPQTSQTMLHVVWNLGMEHCIMEMTMLNRCMSQPGVKTEGEGLSTEGTNIIGCSYTSRKML